ncbi:MAG: methyltransferase domain-containing protein [Elusimicrobia bacterium]|nr:methyltransferase domain-containing protein [Elusimicrobiota bacterium]
MKRPPIRELLVLTFVLSACSLVYEMTIAACFVSFTGDAPLWQSLTIGLYLASLGLGTYFCSRVKPGDEWAALWRVELALTVVGAASALAITTLETAFRIYQHFYAGDHASLGWGLAAVAGGHALTLAIGWLSGYEIPLLLRLAREEGAQDRTRLVLGVNYFGALAGTLLFAVWLLPALDVTGAAAAASFLNLAACAWMYRGRLVARRPDRALALGATAAAWLALLIASPPLSRLNLVSFYSARLGVVAAVDADRGDSRGARAPLGDVLEALWSRRGDVERVPSRVQRIDLVLRQDMPDPLRLHYDARPRHEPDVPYGLALYHDRRYQFYGGVSSIYHEFLAHVPIQAFRRIPEDVLILGGGDGLLARELLKYGDRIRSITNVELDPAMVRLARTDPRLRLLNADSFRDPKVRVVTDDAFFFVRQDRARYDAVYIDFPFPYTYDAAKLYTVEFFRNVSRRLKRGGFCAMDYPLVTEERLQAEKDPEDLRRNSILMNTLEAAGFTTIFPYNTDSPELVTVFEANTLGAPPEDDEGDLENRRLLRRVKARRYLAQHRGLKVDESQDLAVVENTLWRESMVAFARGTVYPEFEFVDLGVPLYALDAKRLKILEGPYYPAKRDPRLVNSVPRPTLFRSLQFIERD